MVGTLAVIGASDKASSRPSLLPAPQGTERLLHPDMMSIASKLLLVANASPERNEKKVRIPHNSRGDVLVWNMVYLGYGLGTFVVGQRTVGARKHAQSTKANYHCPKASEADSRVAHCKAGWRHHTRGLLAAA
eukprot:4155663-Amphidinium_carterae.1